MLNDGDLLGSLAMPPAGRSYRISSNEQPNWHDGNMDQTYLNPGVEFEMPVLEGPGYINHIWMTSHAGGAGELNALTLRIYWDDREEPGVEVPLGDFFAVGHGRPATVESIPVQVSPTGSLTCYWRMPFAKSARIVVRNDNPDRGAGLYWQIDWVKLPELPPDTAYFHARYRQEYPATMAQDYLIADLAGKGRYVGTVMSIALGQDGWFGEGDDFFYIDGEEVPSLQGTGSEDYFNDAWGFRPRTSLWYGQPWYQGYDAGDEGVAYRWHILDAVNFEKSLTVAIEHKGNRPMSEDGFFIERPDFISSVAFWYQVGEPKPWAPLPSWYERRVPWQRQHLLRAFRRIEVTGGPAARISTEGMFGGRPNIVWPNDQPGAALSVPFPVAEAGRHAVRLTGWGGPGSGLFDIEIDGKVVLAACDLRPVEEEYDLLLGTHELAAGEHTLTFRAVGETTGTLGIEFVRTLKLPQEAAREVRTHHEAHFIRLGIGRAVYAYRLAYDKLPESLDELVRMEVMDPMYLRDENGYVLESRVEGGQLCVRSTGPDGWEHAWAGLDARR